LLVGTPSSTESSAAVFQANSGSSTSYGVIKLARGNTPSDGFRIGSLEFTDNGHQSAAAIDAARDGGTWTSGSSHPTRLVFSTTADGASSPTERMRIRNNGNLQFNYIGDNLPGSGNTETGAVFERVSDGASLFISRNSNIAGRFNRNTDGSIHDFRRSGSSVGSISVTTTATAYNTSSDYRLKENVVDLTGAIDRVNQLQVRRFNFIADPGTTVDGFLAHEAQAVVPEAVHGTKDEVDADGNPVYQGIDQSKLVPLLTAALQEALAKIETLEQRLNDAGIA